MSDWVDVKMDVRFGVEAQTCFECGFSYVAHTPEEAIAGRAAFAAHQHITLEGPQPLSCRVYWGSHGCHLPRGHEGPHLCDCANKPDVDPVTREYPDGTLNVGAPPYYGPDTRFYGEDA
jgi:hypothetical protein